ncbi:MAG: bile acid:sodium symporter family protein [Oceanococcus sp.]
MLESLITTGLPIALIIVMIGVGLGLTPADFRRVVQQPKGFIIGAAGQLLLLPLFALMLIKLMGLSGNVAIGLFIIALCPGGTTSNLFSMLAKADVGLSVSLTAVVGFITPFTIPLLASWALTQFGDSSQNFSLPILKTFGQLIVVGVVPVLVGMLIRGKWTGFALRAEPWVNRISSAVLALLIVAICMQLGSKLASAAAAAGLAALFLNLSTMSLGYGLGRTFLSQEKQARTIALEVGMQNGTMALLITTGLLKSAEMSMAPIIYSLLMFATATVFTLLVRHR